ncbi:Stp1/IreP family PP2C-type Ser/Thr phosphatase [candidate division KSB1 bacterium]|nr:Stp1/IreP family PP2C-type Ser/Thr phosphatase [candidate division KSB1 bacterium]
MKVDVALDCYALSDKGLKRRVNEDTYLCDPEGLFVVADGMGGANCGEIASQLTVSTFENCIMPFLIDDEATIPFEFANGEDLFTQAVKHATEQANEVVLRSAIENEECHGMGSTLTAAVIHAGFIYIAHVGDSRLYQCQDGNLSLVTKDHTRVQEMVNRKLISAGEARTHPNRHVITRCIGRKNQLKPDLIKIRLLPNALYMLCSDGLYDMVDDQYIAEIIHQNRSLERMGAQLVDSANRNGGKDNITIVFFRQSPENSDGVLY